MSLRYLTDDSLPKSLYEAQLSSRPQFSAPTKDLKCDVCIIGGGLAGLQTARHLLDSGRSVVVLEANRIGWGASGRNGGQVIPEFASGMTYLERSLGEVSARRCYLLLRTALMTIKNDIGQHQMDCHFEAGHLETAVTPQHAVPLRRWHEHAARRYGAELRYFEREELSEVIGSRRYYGGLLDLEAGHLDPLRFTIGLAQLVVSKGGIIHETSPVIDWVDGDRVRVRTQHSTVNAGTVVLACNVGIDSLKHGAAESLAARTLPVGSWVMATEPLGQTVAAELLPTRAAVADNRTALDYFRLSSDNRLVFGGGASYVGDSSPDGHVTELQRNMLATFPGLADAKIEYIWGGILDATMSRAPDLGALSHNVYYLQGFSGSGLVSTAVAGKAVADCIDGKTSDFAMFGQLAHRAYPGGRRFRGSLVTIAKTIVRLRDRMRVWGLG